MTAKRSINYGMKRGQGVRLQIDSRSSNKGFWGGGSSWPMIT